ncbi:flagellar hook-associated protein 2 [Sphingomonas guangdongensis]|uniref:Flagellar hook-associated protein 2 n=1 Tax=Sphingomonas guangdongensis TaxID=1141890 RepID=A0A285QDX7_9SPHN|nr:flagellar filament capping protein FliD [Sphingomonas guangdongensis]SOB80140.1 flagellar hook-associated protein 2 [Sphingomonas guangdongensis]
MVESIAKTLGTGSGVDTAALVTSLVEAQFAAKTQQYEQRTETLTKQISTVSELKSAMTGFNNALRALVAGGTLSSRLTSSAEGVLKVSATGTAIPAVNSTITVSQLASAQVSTTNTPIDAATAFAEGTLTIQLGADVYDAAGTVTGFAPVGGGVEVTVPAGATLADIAAQINAAGAGVTASVIQDGTGQRLSIRGADGAAKAFEIAAEDTGPGGASLASLAVGRTATGTTSATRANDALVVIDGVRFARATNSITDLVPNVKLDLVAPSTTPVRIGPSRDTAALTQAVNDVVATYNELYTMLRTATDPMTGTLARDSGALEMKRTLGRLTLTDLTGATDGTPKTLAEIGVGTNRDGSLSVDATRLARAVQANPQAVEAMFSDKVTGRGVSSALNAMTVQVTSRSFGLGASESRYTQAQSRLTDDKLELTDQADKMRTRLTQQYASMDARVAVYKSTQAFLTQQIDAWNAD